MFLLSKLFLNKQKRSLCASQRGGASLYALYISLLVGIGAVGYLSNVGNAVRMASSSQVDAKMQIMADATLDIARAQLDEVLVRSAANRGGQGSWDDVFDVENAILGVFDQAKKNYEGLDIHGAEMEVNLTNLPDQSYDGQELTQEEADEYAKARGLEGGQEFEIAKEALLEAVITIGDKKIALTKAVGHKHKHRATFFGVELYGNVVFVMDVNEDWTSIVPSPYREYDRLVPDGNGEYVYEPVEKSRKVRGNVSLADVVKTEAIGALRDMKEGEDAFAAIVGGQPAATRTKSGSKILRSYSILGNKNEVGEEKLGAYRPIYEEIKNNYSSDVVPLFDVSPIAEESRSFLQDAIYSDAISASNGHRPTRAAFRAFREFEDEEVDFLVFVGPLDLGWEPSDVEEADRLGYPVYRKGGGTKTGALKAYSVDKITAGFQELRSKKWSRTKLVSIYLPLAASSHFTSRYSRELARKNKGIFVDAFAGATNIKGSKEISPEIEDFSENE